MSSAFTTWRKIQILREPLILLCLLGAVQATLMALVLITSKRGNRTANRILAAITITISVEVTVIVLNSPYLSRVNHPFDFLGAPLLFLYVKSLTSKAPIFNRWTLLHFAPAVLCALFLLPYYLESSDYKLANLFSLTWYYWRSTLVLAQFALYFIPIGLMIYRYSSKANRESPREMGVLFHLRFLSVSFVVLFLVAIFRFAFDILYPAYRSQTMLILPLGVTLLIYALAYLGLRNSEVLIGRDEEQTEKKYQRSTLIPDRAERYLKKVQHAMEEEKIYTDGDLTLQKLAEHLSIPAHHLSQVVNEQLNQSILDLINSYRIKEAQTALLDPSKKHLSILAIAEDSGFNSKSAFNSAFKKHAGVTPSEFRKKGENGKASF